ncbi:TAP-like protein, partial [Acinetobacter baumannii MRSN 4106]
IGYANCCEALAKADVREQLKDIKIPVLVVAGTQDPITTVADGEFMQQRIPQSKLTEIDASHISNVEQPEAFNKILTDFLVN